MNETATVAVSNWWRQETLAKLGILFLKMSWVNGHSCSFPAEPCCSCTAPLYKAANSKACWRRLFGFQTHRGHRTVLQGCEYRVRTCERLWKLPVGPQCFLLEKKHLPCCSGTNFTYSLKFQLVVGLHFLSRAIGQDLGFTFLRPQD